MSELKTNLEQILQEKTTRLIPENIKRKVEIFDVIGTDGDTEVEELQAKIIETRQEIADTRRDLENSATTVTGTGENVTLNQTAEATLKKLGVGGNSKQNQYTGKNLYNLDAGLNTALIKNGDEYTITKNGGYRFAKEVSCDLEPGTYIWQFNLLSHNLSEYGEGNKTIQMVVKYEDGTNTEVGMYSGSNLAPGLKWRSITFSKKVKVLQLYMEGNFIDGAYITFKDFMLVEGTYTTETMPAYEPYTGGKASPNPDYPQEIKNVTPINVINETLFTENAYNGITWKYDNSSKKIRVYGEATSSYSGSTRISVDLPKGTYKFTPFTDGVLRYNMWLYDANQNLIGNTKLNNPVTINEDIKYIGLFAENMTSGTTYDEELNVQLEKGTTNHNYAPYDCIPIIVQNKNLADIELPFTTNTSGAFSKYLTSIPNIKSNTSYTLTGKCSDGTELNALNSVFVVMKGNTQLLNWGLGRTSSTTTDISEATSAYIYTNATLAGKTITEFQIEQNTVATDYTPHKEQTFIFPLGNEKLMLGDYLADDGIHHVRGQVVLDGTEGWFRNDLTTGQRFALNVANFNFKKITSLGDDLLSNYFKGISYSAYYSTGGINGVSYNYYSNINYLQIFLKENYTLNEFKTWLQTKYNNNTPVIVEYELEQEVVVPYTEEQQQVYDEMKKAISYEEQTNVIGSSGGSNPIFTVTAFRDADLAIASLDNRVTLLED